MNNLSITPMLQKNAWEISKWKYDGIYAFYNRSDNNMPTGNADAPVDNSFVVYNNDGILIGHFHFGPDGQIPTIENYKYTGDYLDIGLGLRPDLCGRGYGAQFTTFGIEFAKNHYGFQKFRLSVAAFNERAQKVYEHIGFRKTCEVTNSYFKNKFYIMTLE